MHKSCLTLKNYIVNTINFSINEKFQNPEGKPVELRPEFQRKIGKIDDNNVLVSLRFSIKNENNDMPFDIYADIRGAFELENWESPELLPLITSNAVAILFPYLRSLITMVTANANISPYVLPVMNIGALFEQNNNQENTNENNDEEQTEGDE